MDDRNAGPRIAVTGMAINTPLGDTLDGFLEALLAGRSALGYWKALDTSRIYAKVGADLSDYDERARFATLGGRLPDEMHHRIRKLLGRVAWSSRLSILLAADAYVDAGLAASGIDPELLAAIVAGHNLNANYHYDNRVQFADEPDFMDSMLALHGLDTDHAGCISEVLNIRGPIYTVGAACASGNAALRSALDEIRYHDAKAAVVVGAVLDLSPVELHAMALMGAISFESFNDAPEKASRPFDVRREGFVPAHGGGALIVENMQHALERGARIYAEILGVESSSDANHLPQPSAEGQARLMARVLRKCNLAPEDIDYISAHATSTPLGDVTEIRSIKQTFGRHAFALKLNATKSMLGHTCWAAPIVETIAAILQMNAGRLHPSINVDELDPEIDLDVCASAEPTDYDVRTVMKNSFGFGGINSVSILRRVEPS
jgi:3-oxoacyl-(acyl-carrier-protein) synthase